MSHFLPPPPLLRRMMEQESESPPAADRWVELDEHAERAPSTIPSPPPSAITDRCPVSDAPACCPLCGLPARATSSAVLTIPPTGSPQ